MTGMLTRKGGSNCFDGAFLFGCFARSVALSGSVSEGSSVQRGKREGGGAHTQDDNKKKHLEIELVT